MSGTETFLTRATTRAERDRAAESTVTGTLSAQAGNVVRALVWRGAYPAPWVVGEIERAHGEAEAVAIGLPPDATVAPTTDDDAEIVWARGREFLYVDTMRRTPTVVLRAGDLPSHPDRREHVSWLVAVADAVRKGPGDDEGCAYTVLRATGTIHALRDRGLHVPLGDADDQRVPQRAGLDPARWRALHPRLRVECLLGDANHHDMVSAFVRAASDPDLFELSADAGVLLGQPAGVHTPDELQLATLLPDHRLSMAGSELARAGVAEVPAGASQWLHSLAMDRLRSLARPYGDPVVAGMVNHLQFEWLGGSVRWWLSEHLEKSTVTLEDLALDTGGLFDSEETSVEGVSDVTMDAFFALANLCGDDPLELAQALLDLQKHLGHVASTILQQVRDEKNL